MEKQEILKIYPGNSLLNPYVAGDGPAAQVTTLRPDISDGQAPTLAPM
jgi:hypothetical protein